MTEQELKEIMAQLEAAGCRAQLCDTPVPVSGSSVRCGLPTEIGDEDYSEYVMLQGNPTKKLYDKDKDITIRAAIGAGSVIKGGVKVPTGNAVKSMKLLAQATGAYTREELNKDAVLAWTDKAQKEIADAKAAAEEDNGD